MLEKLRIIQVGDIHLPTSAQQPAAIDKKDPKFSKTLENIISHTPLKVVFRGIYELIEKADIDAILFMGDLTDKGDANGYRACCKYIADALQLGANGIHRQIPVGIVPGNHDLSRLKAKEPGFTKKFAPLSEALSLAGLPTCPVKSPIAVPLKTAGAAVDV